MVAHPCVVFDVDGTLTATTGVDDECLVAAWRGVFGIPPTTHIDTDWSRYEHSTDEGLTLEVCRRALGRGPTREEVGRVQERFFGLLRERIGKDRSLCVAVPGAGELLAALARGGWRVGIASGAWERSARIKLEAAGVDVDGPPPLPATFSHARAGDGEPARREEILGTTLRALGHSRGSGAVYVGDGVWDARAARAAGIGFLGVRVDGRHERLAAEGATRIVRDFSRVDEVVGMIEDAMSHG